MFAQITLDLINDEAVAEYNRRLKAGEIKKRSQRPIVFPFAVLMAKFMSGPPNIAELAMRLAGQGNSLSEFKDLIKEFLPEYELDILSNGPQGQVERFMALFSKYYFPLDTYREFEDTDDFTYGMPIELQGMSEEQYSDFGDMRPGLILMLSLIHAPWENTDDDDAKNCSRGMMIVSDKLPILEKTGTLIGDIDLLKKIPKHGWDDKQLRAMVGGTSQYWALADYAEYVNCNTKWDILNYTHQDAIVTMPWTVDAVKTMTIQWPEIQAFWDRVDNMATWLEKDLTGNYRELVNHLCSFKEEKKKTPRKHKEKKPANKERERELVGAA